MKKAFIINIALTCIIVLSLFLKLLLIFKYNNQLTLESDDLNYIKSAVVLLRKGIFTYQKVTEPTVFIMPLHPLLLAGIFKIAGYSLEGIQAIRVFQAVISCTTIILIYLTANLLFNKKIGLLTAFLVAFYIPNIVTCGYVLTETLFSALLCLLIYITIKFSEDISNFKIIIIAAVFALTVLCRPTAAFYPIFFFLYLIFYKKTNFYRLIYIAVILSVTFVLLMIPWWVRNFLETSEFIPLTASSGNPMLQGTYINYKQTPENVEYYNLGNTALETDKIEANVAKNRIVRGFRNNFWEYLRWYTLGKTYYMWKEPFYWKKYFDLNPELVLKTHRFLLLGFIGIIICLYKNPKKYLLPISIIVYFNIIHCIYMSFDRYAFPLMPILSMFCASFIYEIISMLNNVKIKLL